MKFYLTAENSVRLKRSFLNLKLFHVIDVPEILLGFGYTLSTIDEYSAFIVSKKINNLINTYSRSKRIRGIIYSNPVIDEDLIPNLFNTLDDNIFISDVVLMDDYNAPKLKHLYPFFEEIIFFPSVRKVRIIECVKLWNVDNELSEESL